MKTLCCIIDFCKSTIYVDVDTAVFTLDAGPLARCQCPEGPATYHLDTGFFLVSLCLESKC